MSIFVSNISKGKNMKFKKLSALFFLFLIFINGCISPKINLISNPKDPLEEFTLSGQGNEKILLVPINGVISNKSEERFFIEKPGMVQEVMGHLQKAENDPSIKAIVLKVNSPGGTITASDIIYHELKRFREKTGKKIVVLMMDLAASGGYYVSLPSDYIMAHPTTITGSIGVIFLRPNVAKILDKFGINVATTKSGDNKDMGSPFRQPSTEEEKLFQKYTDEMAKRFFTLVTTHRKISKEQMDVVKTARIFLADEAKSLGLIDQTGYIDDAIKKAAEIASIPADSKVIVYRRSQYNNDNAYNEAVTFTDGKSPGLIKEAFGSVIPDFETGLYYMWHPEN